mmetsp:Transcript_7365/g.23553  ORF Transcript_7365/g.23553 Transcript_7365/m.23553 type:complete len:340 (-) Transcript_7365:337-1356(-)
MKAGAGLADAVRHGVHGLVLPNDVLFEDLVQVQQLFALTVHQRLDWDACGVGHHLRDEFAGHRVLEERGLASFLALAISAAALGLCLLLCQLLQVRDDRVAQLTGARKVATALRAVELQTGLLEALLGALDLVEPLALLPPLFSETLQLGLHAIYVFLDLVASGHRVGVALLLQRLELDALGHDGTFQLPDWLGLALLLHAQAARGLVHKVDGLVGHLAVGEVPLGQRRGCDERVVLDGHAVVDLVLLLEAAQDRNSVLSAGLFHEHRLEAARQGSVLFDVLAVLVQGGRADAAQLAARERRLEDVGGADRSVAAASPHEHVELVDEKDDLAVALLDVL